MSIGGLRDDPEFCRTAADYLEIHKNLLTTQLNHETIELERKQSEQE
jgi:hypothetical protein